jgi:hypothetical protein
MSGVVLRCPSCGTTKAAPGECDACHEAQVRYYCTNHTPGRWLDSRSCPQCGSQFGVPDRPPVVHAPPRSPPASPPPPPAAALPPKAGRKGYTSWPTRGPWGRRVLPGHERATRPMSDAFRDAIERRLPERFKEAANAITPVDGEVSFGSFRLRPSQQLLLDDDKPIPIGARALDLLITLVERAGDVVTKDELISRVWPNVAVEASSRPSRALQNATHLPLVSVLRSPPATYPRDLLG